MYYSVEDIYKYLGQFDKTVTVSFYPSSDAFINYGPFVTGTFYYTSAERQKLGITTSKEGSERNDGLVKIDISYSNGLTKTQKDELKYHGIKASEISEILKFNEPLVNEYSKSDIRSLPDPIDINVDFSGIDEEELFLWLNNSKLRSGYKLIPSEINRHNGIMLRKYEDINALKEIKSFINPETGNIKDEIRYEYLKSKFIKGLITEIEKKEFDESTNLIVNRRVEILKKELMRSTNKFKEIGINYKEGLNILLYLTSRFEDEQLNAGKFPVWWDYERFIHIYMRHVKETQIGDRFASKSVFQYNLKDIKRLVKAVLEEIEEEIQEHFRNHPKKGFRRTGEMSVYYRGDYYAVQIANDGKLMRFHKNN